MESEEELERLVCFCHQVTRKEVYEAIRLGAKTLSEIQDQTLASTGCGGCRVDVEKILANFTDQ